MASSKELRIPARDGLSLAATLFEPEAAEGGEPVVLVNSATAVLRRYYRHYAQFLTQFGWRVVTFDYRGIGESAPARLRGYQATMRQWGELDIAGAIDWIESELEPPRLVVVAHSVGGQLMGLVPNRQRVAGMLSVGSQSGYFGHWPLPGRLGIIAFWFGVIPVVTGLCGFFPAKGLRIAENLPAGVARQWARWGRRRSYLIDGPEDAAAFADWSVPIRSYSIEGDGYGPLAAVDALHALFTGAEVERIHLRSAEAPLGHFGFFRRGAPEGLWEETAQWLGEVIGD